MENPIALVMDSLIREQRKSLRNVRKAELAKQWRLNNKDKVKERELKRSKSENRIRYTRNLALKKYGISTEEYNILYELQDGLCAICMKPETQERNGNKCKLSVDHDHASGEIRGLLCSKCNLGIGIFNDDLNILTRAAAYILESNKESMWRNVFDRLYKINNT